MCQVIFAQAQRSRDIEIRKAGHCTTKLLISLLEIKWKSGTLVDFWTGGKSPAGLGFRKPHCTQLKPAVVHLFTLQFVASQNGLESATVYIFIRCCLRLDPGGGWLSLETITIDRKHLLYLIHDFLWDI